MPKPHAPAARPGIVLSGTDDPSIHAAINRFRHVVRVLRVSAREAEDTVGISAARLFVLSRLAAAPSLSRNEGATLTHQSSASAVVARLATRGSVRRDRASDDAWRLVLAITPAGRKLLARAPGVAQDRLIDALARLPALRRRRLAVALTEVVALLGQEKHPSQYFFVDGTQGEPATRRKKPPRGDT